MPQSQNGWPVLDADQIRVWALPDRNGKPLRYPGGDIVQLPLARGAAGFILAHTALWYHERVESLTTQRQHDEWGWAPRDIRGSSTISNHASGTAMDLNATLHPMGVPTLNTMTHEKVATIHRHLRWLRVLRWGGDYVTRPDAMHWEVDASPARVRLRVARLLLTKRGRRIHKLNPWSAR